MTLISETTADPIAIVSVPLRSSAKRRYLADRSRILTALADRVPQELLAPLISDLESAQEDMGVDERGRVSALVALANHCDDSGERTRVLAGVLRRADRPPSWYVFGPALVDMAVTAPEPLRTQAVAIALRDCFSKTAQSDPAELAGVLQPPDLIPALDHAARIPETALRVAATAAVLRRAGQLSSDEPPLAHIDVLAAWPVNASVTQLFDLVAASAWWIQARGGDAAITSAIEAVYDADRWWR